MTILILASWISLLPFQGLTLTSAREEVPSSKEYGLIGIHVMRSKADGSSSEWLREFVKVPKYDRDRTIKLYPELNHLDQKDESLISFLRDHILIHPSQKLMTNGRTNGEALSLKHKSKSKKTPILQRLGSKDSLCGQSNQPAYVEQLLKLKEKKRDRIKQKTTTKCNSSDITENITGKPRAHTDKRFRQSQRSKIAQFQEVLIPKSMIPKTESQKYNGFYIEAGAGDGEIISNSLYFEINYKWTGLLVEPNPDFHDALISKQRNAWILPHCLSTKTTPIIVDFFANLLLGGIINEETSENPHNHTSDGMVRRKIKVQCFPLYSVLKAIGNPKVDYFSLDIEGPEFQVLKTIPWPMVDIRVLGIETDHAGKLFEGSEDDISKYLNSVGYNKTQKLGGDLFFMNTQIE